MKNNKTLVVAGKDNLYSRLLDVFSFRDLFWALALRDYRVRYAQTLLGFTWALIQPVVTLLIFILVFQKAAKIETGDIPYSIFALSGLTVWAFFAYVLSQSGTSIISAQDMIKKIYFPRLIIPLSKSVVGAIDFMITFVLLILLMFYFDLSISTNILFIPIALILIITSSLGMGIWFSALSIRFRDFQHIIPFVVQIGLYVSPVAYPASIVTDNIPSWADKLFYLNPMAGTIDIFRFCMMGIDLNLELVMISVSSSLLLFISSLFFFLRTEKSMADFV